MGMFDYVICEMALPQQPRPPRTRLFQTKDTTPQFLERFTITTNGRLIHHRVHYQQVPLSERPYAATPVIGSIRAIPAGVVDTNFHGMLEFHAYDSESREYWSYGAKFTAGQCVEIYCAEYERRFL
jgi:hypothetical protein